MDRRVTSFLAMTTSFLFNRLATKFIGILQGQVWSIAGDKTFRGYGFGGKLIQSAKNEAKELGKKRILFDTLKVNLNKFYQKLDADVMGEGYFIHEPATKLQFALNDNRMGGEVVGRDDAEEANILRGRRYSCPSL